MTSEQVKAFWSCFLENEEKIYRLGRLPNGEGADDIDKIISPKMKDNMGFETGPINDADGKSLGLSHPISEFCILVRSRTWFGAQDELQRGACPREDCPNPSRASLEVHLLQAQTAFYSLCHPGTG